MYENGKQLVNFLFIVGCCAVRAGLKGLKNTLATNQHLLYLRQENFEFAHEPINGDTFLSHRKSHRGIILDHFVDIRIDHRAIYARQRQENVRLCVCM